jgi:hypothetical protein
MAMMQIVDPSRLQLFVALLAEPDPADLPRRRHVLRYAGESERRTTRLPGILMAWLQRRHLSIDVEAQPAAAVRGRARHVRQPNPGLRILRPTGTC